MIPNDMPRLCDADRAWTLYGHGNMAHRVLASDWPTAVASRPAALRCEDLRAVDQVVDLVARLDRVPDPATIPGDALEEWAATIHRALLVTARRRRGRLGHLATLHFLAHDPEDYRRTREDLRPLDTQ